MLRAVALASALSWAVALPASAQERILDMTVPDLSRPEYQEFLTFMRSAQVSTLGILDQMSCGTGPCSPATPEELANPPLTDEDLFRIGYVGIRTAMAEHCGLEWERLSFVPMMMEWRDSRNPPNRILALVAGIHGHAQGSTLLDLQAEGPCDDQMRASVETRLSF